MYSSATPVIHQLSGCQSWKGQSAAFDLVREQSPRELTGGSVKTTDWGRKAMDKGVEGTRPDTGAAAEPHFFHFRR